MKLIVLLQKKQKKKEKKKGVQKSWLPNISEDKITAESQETSKTFNIGRSRLMHHTLYLVEACCRSFTTNLVP